MISNQLQNCFEIRWTNFRVPNTWLRLQCDCVWASFFRRKTIAWKWKMPEHVYSASKTNWPTCAYRCLNLTRFISCYFDLAIFPLKKNDSNNCRSNNYKLTICHRHHWFNGSFSSFMKCIPFAYKVIRLFTLFSHEDEQRICQKVECENSVRLVYANWKKKRFTFREIEHILLLS